MQIIANQGYPNRLQWVLENYTGPFVQTGPLGTFDPRRDLEVYVDGALTPVSTFIFDAANNRYLFYMSNSINLQGVIQVVHHMPNPPFVATAPTVYLPSFALIGTYSSQGDSTLPSAAIAALVPTSVSGGYIMPNTPVYVIWNITNVSEVIITGNNGVDPVVNTGLLNTMGLTSGNVEFSNGFTQSITLTFEAYSSTSPPIIVATQTLLANYA